MKCSLQQHAWLKSGIFQLLCIALLFSFVGCHKGDVYPPKATVTTVATGLQGPMGMEIDGKGNIWVAETGSGSNDGKILIVKPNGTKYDAIINLSSMPNAESGEREGPSHLLLDKGWLYILSADYLYKANVASFKPGDKAIDGSKLAFEDVGTAIRAMHIVTPNDSHPYNLTKGPDGDLYMVDAGANAVIHRTSAGKYSVLAMLPNLPNPTGIGGPTEQAVPT
ncbi:MAG: ScyD/ScyE family protein, partial [Ginsengibacter sp.]